MTCATRVTRGTFDFQEGFSLRKVMGGVVFSGPSLQSALVRRTCQRSVGSRLLRNRRPYAAKCRAFFPGIPCNTTATHPAAPLGSGRRSAPPLSFATRNLQKWQEVNEDELCDEEFTSNFQ